MSSQLEGMFESLGMPVVLKTGGDGQDRHMWIRIGCLEVDSVSLFPVVNTRYNYNQIEYESFDIYENS